MDVAGPLADLPVVEAEKAAGPEEVPDPTVVVAELDVMEVKVVENARLALLSGVSNVGCVSGV